MSKLSTVPLKPRDWPSWLAILLLRLIALLPYRVLMSLGRQIGLLGMRLFKSRVHVAEVNFRHCFPQLNEQARLKLIRQTFAANGQGLFEALFAWWASKRRLSKLKITINGLELLQPEHANQGIIVLFPHLTTLEICGRIVAELAPLCAVYQTQTNRVFDYVLKHERTRYFHKVYNRRDLRAIVKKLRSGGIIVYLPDQDFGVDNSVFAPFFGVSTSTATSTARLAQMGNAKLLIASGQRYDQDQGYLITIKEFPTNFPSGNDIADATVVNQQLEQVIMQEPSNYFWLHRRFKTRPAGEKPLY